MRILVDTNIILRLAQPNNPQRPDIVSALAVLTAAKHEICVVPLNPLQFWHRLYTKIRQTRSKRPKFRANTNSKVSSGVDCLDSVVIRRHRAAFGISSK